MATRPPTRAEIVDLLGSEPRPMHTREIATRLAVSDVDYLELQQMLDDLSLEGVLAARPGQRFKLREAATSSRGSRESEREGLLTVHPKGFGFVAALGATSIGDDVFVPPDALGGAMHGDKVVVRIAQRSARGAQGEVVRIIDRGMKRVAGTLRRRGRSTWLEPDDTRIRGPIVLPHAVDAGSEGNSGTDGDAVVVAITRFPERPEENPEGRIETVLGRPGELRVEAAKILVLESIEETHTEKAIAEAEAYGPEVPEAMKEGREDLRDVPLPTIDPEDARDHDDAVWVARTDSGGYRAWIAIADVSTYVTAGTALDDEAKKRGVSVYLPDRAIPMLPRALASNLCSLLPDVDRLCLCVIADLDAAGDVVSTRLVRGVMRSRAKLTYGGVARALGLSEEAKREPLADEMVDGLRVAYELSRILRSRRMKRGALDFELPEAKVVLDEAREPIDVVRRAGDEGVKKAYQLIEELMLFANETVARWCQEREIPTIFRVHPPPDEQKLERFSALCESLGIAFEEEDTRDPKKLGDLLKSFADHPLARVLNSLLLRSMKQATYDVVNIGHFGLASKAYLHFTSPIRRYPDLVVHRIVHQALSPRGPRRDDGFREKLAEAALASSQAERRAMEVERAIVDLYRTFMMKSRIGERFEGTVTAVVGSGVFVQLDAPFVDVLVRLEEMGFDRWEVDDESLRVIAGRSGEVVGLGDRMVVTIIDAAILRRTVYGRRLSGSAVDELRVRVPRRPLPKPSRNEKHEKPGRASRPERGERTERAPRAESAPAHRGRKGKPKLSSSHAGKPVRKGKNTKPEARKKTKKRK